VRQVGRGRYTEKVIDLVGLYRILSTTHWCSRSTRRRRAKALADAANPVHHNNIRGPRYYP